MSESALAADTAPGTATAAPADIRAGGELPSPGELLIRADEVIADGGLGEIALRGGVVLRYGRYRIESESLRIARRPDGVDVEGEARLALCPCPEPPITFAFRGGSASAEGDVTMWFPRLQVLGVPVFALPWIWIRSSNQAGLLPPSFEWRGRDGLRIGSGVHLPWTGADGAPRVVEATLAGYAKGGVAIGGRLLTPTSTARAEWDWLGSNRVAISAIGHSDTREAGEIAAAWDVDAITGDRARSGAADLRAAAAPFNTGVVEASIRAGEMGRELSALLATGVALRGWRGEAPESDRGTSPAVAGPTASLAIGGALSPRGSWDASIQGAVLGDIDGAGALSFARASMGGLITIHPGPFEVRVGSRAGARVGDRGGAEPSIDAVLGGRVSLGLPLARTFGGDPGEAPLVHIITPIIEARAGAAVERGELFELNDIPSMSPGARWVTSAGLSTSLGRYTGDGVRADIRAGILGAGGSPTHSMAHARAAAQGKWLAGDLEAAATVKGPSVSTIERGLSGLAFLARTRIGPLESASLRVGVAAELGVDASAARSIAEGVDEIASPASALGYLASSGWTGSAELSIPWSRVIRTVFRADADFIEPRLLAAAGVFEAAHPCGCFSLAVTGGYRLGRGGPDVALAVDLAPAIH